MQRDELRVSHPHNHQKSALILCHSSIARARVFRVRVRNSALKVIQLLLCARQAADVVGRWRSKRSMKVGLPRPRCCPLLEYINQLGFLVCLFFLLVGVKFNQFGTFGGTVRSVLVLYIINIVKIYLNMIMFWNLFCIFAAVIIPHH